MLRTICMSSNRTHHLLKGFIHQWTKYCTLPVTIVHQHDMPPRVPVGWSTYRVPDDSDEINWTGQLSQTLSDFNDEIILLVMDDYWLCEPVDHNGLNNALHEFYYNTPPIAWPDKIDLSGDRLGFPHIKEKGTYVLSKNDAPYLTSTQAALWRKHFLKTCCFEPTWTPWQFELDGTEKIKGEDWTILGLKTPCVQYANVSLRGQKELRLERLTEQDRIELKQIGAI